MEIGICDRNAVRSCAEYMEEGLSIDRNRGSGISQVDDQRTRALMITSAVLELIRSGMNNSTPQTVGRNSSKWMVSIGR